MLNMNALERIQTVTITESMGSDTDIHDHIKPEDRAEIISISKLLEMDIRIPEYQRP
jgi:hypothetical protein